MSHGINPETEAALRDLRDGDFELCPRCRCCEIETEECDQCGGEGVNGHDCGEDCCACLYPEENVVCDQCGGEGFWRLCVGRCDADGRHAPDPLNTQTETFLEGADLR